MSRALLLLAWAAACSNRPSAALVLDVAAAGQSTREIGLSLRFVRGARRELKFARPDGLSFPLEPARRVVVTFDHGDAGRGTAEVRVLPDGGLEALLGCVQIDIQPNRVETHRVELARDAGCAALPGAGGATGDGGAGGNGGDGGNGGSGGAPGDGWRALATAGAPTARHGHTAVWTGSEMIIWGGQDDAGTALDTGARYRPDSDTWIATDDDDDGNQGARTAHTAVWTGSEMIVWGGRDAAGMPAASGKHYRPDTNVWTPVTATMAPAARHRHVAVAARDEMLVWGGRDGADQPLASGGDYDVRDRDWGTLGNAGAPAARSDVAAVWSGRELIVWGGLGTTGVLSGDGARYDPGPETWRPLSTAGAPAPRAQHVGVWAPERDELLVWGGLGATGPLGDGARWHADSDRWQPIASGGPAPRVGAAAVWTGRELVVFGGGAPEPLGDGARYDPAAARWTALPEAGAPSPRTGHTAVWTGREIIVWGGIGPGGALGDGARHAIP